MTKNSTIENTKQPEISSQRNSLELDSLSCGVSGLGVSEVAFVVDVEFSAVVVGSSGSELPRTGLSVLGVSGFEVSDVEVSGLGVSVVEGNSLGLVLSVVVLSGSIIFVVLGPFGSSIQVALSTPGVYPFWHRHHF